MATSSADPPPQPARRGPTPGTPRPPRMTREAREHQIQQIATEVFTTRGFLDTTMEEIADRAGITKPVIYDHFGSKEGLLGACVAAASDGLQRATMGVWEVARPGATVKDYIRESTRAVLCYFTENESSLRLLRDLSAASPAGAAQVERLRQAQVRACVDMLRRVDSLRDRPTAYLEAVAEGIVGVEDRLLVWRSRHPEATVEEVVEIVADLIWGGLRGLVVPR